MKEELTTAMHSEFAISEPAQKKHDAFAVFQLVSDNITLNQALDFLLMTPDQVRPFVADWNALSTKEIVLE